VASAVRRGRAASGCLGLLVGAFRRRRAGSAIVEGVEVSWSRSLSGQSVALGCAIDAPQEHAAGLVREVTARLAEVLASRGLAVGVVGVVRDEEPVLLALAPRRDVVAPLVQETLSAGAAHRRKRVWLGLDPGTYLATVVDPYRPFAGGGEEIANLVARGRARYAIAVEAATGGGRVRIAVVGYGARSELRRLVSLARRPRSVESGRAAAR